MNIKIGRYIIGSFTNYTNKKDYYTHIYLQGIQLKCSLRPSSNRKPFSMLVYWLDLGPHRCDVTQTQEETNEHQVRLSPEIVVIWLPAEQFGLVLAHPADENRKTGTSRRKVKSTMKDHGALVLSCVCRKVNNINYRTPDAVQSRELGDNRAGI